MAKRATAGVKPEAEEKPAKRHKAFEEVGEALKMLERRILKRDPKEERKELLDAMSIWQEEAELGEEIQKRHAAKPKAVGRWNRKDRVEDEAEAAKAARVEVMEKEQYEDEKEEEHVKEAEEDMEHDDGGGAEQQGGDEQQVGEGHEEEGAEHDELVSPDEMEAGQGEQDEMDDDGQGHQEKQKQDGWWGQQGWWKRNWKGRNYGGAWHPRPHKPHWASWKPRQRSFSSGSAKGTGKGKFDAWGGEYCVGGYKDVAGNFYERL